MSRKKKYKINVIDLIREQKLENALLVYGYDCSCKYVNMFTLFE